MEPYLLHLFLSFIAGLVVGIIVMLLVNKLKTGKLSPSAVKQEYQEYQERVEEHFEQTSKKFKDMTEQYQDLYQHLSVGATSLCRPDSVAASLADENQPMNALEQKEPVADAAAVQENVEKEVEPTSVVSETEETDVENTPNADQGAASDNVEADSAKTEVGNKLKQTEADIKSTS